MPEDKGKKYTFRESDLALQGTLDELTKNRQLTQTMHNLLVNGLRKSIRKTQSQLKQRLASMSKAATKLEGRYKKGSGSG